MCVSGIPTGVNDAGVSGAGSAYGSCGDSIEVVVMAVTAVIIWIKVAFQGGCSWLWAM